MKRNIGLPGATGVGIGAIVGGGILALAGVAYATTGPSAIIAFALNGVIAFLTALSFAEMSAAFPESGGAYTFAKKVLTVQSAFMIGWVVWFASIVAAVLYAIGFAAFAIPAFAQIWSILFGNPPGWLSWRATTTLVAVAATLLYALSLARKIGGGGLLINIGKLIVFAVLILGGFWALSSKSHQEISTHLTPFFSAGAYGLIQAMGFTFIALQGFDLIAAVGGEIKKPEQNIPKAIVLSLTTALAIYLPLLLIIAVVGTQPGQSIQALSAKNPETVIAVAAQNYLGLPGYWLVMLAGILSMLSALRANIFAASRMALTMAGNRTLPPWLEMIHQARGTPVAAIAATAVIVVILLLVLPDVASAGAASSLIFLITFALAHWISILIRQRGGAVKDTFRVPWFPYIQVTGALACTALAIFQGFAVPAAGIIASTWLGLGGIFYLVLFARRARVVDASAEALDPQLVRLRGRNPLVLVPISNPANAQSMVAVANALAPVQTGRVLLLSVVKAPENWQQTEPPQELLSSQEAVKEALTASFVTGLAPEALTTVARDPWDEISRVARFHNCESLLLGFSHLTEHVMHNRIEEVISTVNCDVVLLRAPQGWQLSQVKRILVPIGGRSGHNELRARLLGSLLRTVTREITFLTILSENSSKQAANKARHYLARLAKDEVPGRARVSVRRHDDTLATISGLSAKYDLVILGLQRFGRYHKAFGEFTLNLARETDCPIMMLSRRG